ncbi:lysine 2,3-aminomutase [Planctomycetota bacterium]
MTTTITTRQREVIDVIDEDARSSQWRDWKWHAKNAIRTVSRCERLLGKRFSPETRRQLNRTLEKFPLSITPYYFSLIDADEPDNDPIFKQAFPSVRELDVVCDDMPDPLHEDKDSPVVGITHRYPDRVLFHVSNVCAMYCRHCTRKRKVGDIDSIPSRADVRRGIEYIRRTPVVRDVLLSGGDPFMLSESYLDWILGEVRAIPHVEVVRIGTRIPAVLPYRVTDELVDVLRKYHPLWVNVQFNHPREFTGSARRALKKLADAGVPLGNQSVLLAEINDCPRIMKSLMHKLVANRVRPYYVYQCDLSEGLAHFRTPVGKGMEIIESLIGHTSGFAVPTFVVDAPGGGGKIPMSPNYVLTWSTHKVVLRNYEGVICTYREPDDYPLRFCDRNCKSCDLQLRTADAAEPDAVGISRLLADDDEAYALIPQDNERHMRRNGDNGE